MVVELHKIPGVIGDYWGLEDVEDTNEVIITLDELIYAYNQIQAVLKTEGVLAP
jgi:hypothetical protein